MDISIYSDEASVQLRRDFEKVRYACSVIAVSRPVMATGLIRSKVGSLQKRQLNELWLGNSPSRDDGADTGQVGSSLPFVKRVDVEGSLGSNAEVCPPLKWTEPEAPNSTRTSSSDGGLLGEGASSSAVVNYSLFAGSNETRLRSDWRRRAAFIAVIILVTVIFVR